MNNQDKYTSQLLSKKIQDKAIEKGFELPESEYCRIVDNETGKSTLMKSWKPFDKMKCKKYSYYKAFDIAELGEILKESKILDRVFFLKFSGQWAFVYTKNDGSEKEIFAKSEAEVRGKMFYYLLKNDLL